MGLGTGDDLARWLQAYEHGQQKAQAMVRGWPVTDPCGRAAATAFSRSSPSPESLDYFSSRVIAAQNGAATVSSLRLM